MFRKDINGLRAIAVIAVVIFHFNSSWLSGGFSGVDVFFVISGYLMTRIIFRGVENNSFSLVQFYVSRASRIVPALAVLCLFLLIFGWLFVTPYEYRALGKHVAASLGFVSNLAYWLESGYFDAASHGKWLLHTWSLSVEWQFYIIFPIVVLLMNSIFSKENVSRIMLAGTILGFAFCVYASILWPNPAYYLLPTRAWEMLAGGLVFLYPWKLSGNGRKIIEASGFILIFASFVFVSESVSWPGYLALAPVLGTFLVLQAGRSSYLTSNPVMQYLGTWSYSIYLWHWPIVVLWAYLGLSSFYTCLGIAISLVLGVFSYKFIESIDFKVKIMKISDVFRFIPAYMVLVVGVLGSLIFLNNGFSDHYSEKVRLANLEQKNRNPFSCMSGENFPCVIGNEKKVSAIVVGDSHADAIITGVAEVFEDQGSGVFGLVKSSCPFILKAHFVFGDECHNENIHRLEYLSENYSNVPLIWIARTSSYIFGQSNPDRVNSESDLKPSIYFNEICQENCESLLRELESALLHTISIVRANRPVIIVLPTPEMRFNVPKEMSKSLLLFDEFDTKGLNYSKYMSRNGEVRDILIRIAKKTNSVYLDPSEFLCEGNICFFEVDGRPIYYDGDHMSEFGNKLLVPMFRTAFEK